MLLSLSFQSFVAVSSTSAHAYGLIFRKECNPPSFHPRFPWAIYLSRGPFLFFPLLCSLRRRFLFLAARPDSSSPQRSRSGGRIFFFTSFAAVAESDSAEAEACKPKSCIQLGRPVYVGLLPQLSALCLIGCVGGLSLKWKGRSPDAALPFASLPRILAVLHEGDSPPRRVGRQPFPHFLYCLLPTTATSDLISYLFSAPPPQNFSKNPDTALLEKS